MQASQQLALRTIQDLYVNVTGTGVHSIAARTLRAHVVPHHTRVKSTLVELGEASSSPSSRWVSKMTGLKPLGDASNSA